MDREYEDRLVKRSQGGADSVPSTPSPKRAPRGSPARDRYSDRFIPFRPEGGLGGVRDLLGEDSPSSLGGSEAAGSASGVSSKDDPGKITYNLLLKNELLGAGVLDMKDVYYIQQQNKSAAAGGSATGASAATSDGDDGSVVVEHDSVFSFRRDKKMRGVLSTSQPESAYSLSPVGMDSQNLLLSPRRAPRKISKVPFKVLDAPELQDDFYLNLVDWSSQNVLSVGLGSCVYLWSACTSQVTKLCDLSPDDSITSVRWMQRGSHLAVGTNKGEVQLWDVAKCSKVRTLTGHTGRVGSLAWNSHVLASGSRDRLILQRDVRSQEPFSHKLSAHKQEVCGLQWSPDDQHLASGGNDNKLYIWTLGQPTPVQKYSEHKAAVKAIAWSPHQHGLLASGGGTADQCIRFWNTLTGQPLQCIDTKSQVCNIAWSKHSNELVSTHGYSQNQIAVWKYPSMTQVAALVGHTFRVLYLAMSPDGQTIVTGAGDETLRFWNVFSKSRSQKSPSSVLNMFSHIR